MVNLSFTVFEKALEFLEDEVHPDADPVEASVEYRNHLCKALFYKFVLSAAGDRVGDPRLRSGADADLKREVSRGQQTYSTDPAEYPIGEPVQKLEGKAQGGRQFYSKKTFWTCCELLILADIVYFVLSLNLNCKFALGMFLYAFLLPPSAPERPSTPTTFRECQES